MTINEIESKMAYYQCGRCWQIESESEWLVEQDNKVCKHCHTNNRYEIWPSTEIRELFETIAKYEKIDTFEYGLVASVFISAALELLLERLLFTMAIEDMLYDEVGHLIEYLLDSNQGRTKRIQLYKRLGFGSFEKESSEVGCKLFLKHWAEISAVRNKSVHGDLKEGTKLRSTLVETTITEALDVFSRLHNKYNAYGISYKVATDPIREFENEKAKEMEKLRKWKRQVIGEVDPTEDE
jgi:hypothetical protein